MVNTTHITYDDSWPAALQHPTIAGQDVHLWKIDLLPAETQSDALGEILSVDEKLRAGRFKFPEHRRAFVAARGALRLLLSRYLNVPPQSLTFSVGSHGKPFLNEPRTSQQISFNISHSHHLALMAFTRGREVGVDLEFHRTKLSHEALIDRICSDQEIKDIQRLSPAAQRQAFLNCWTRKEAYVKATGRGITHPLKTITVSLLADQPAALLDVSSDERAPRHWTMKGITVAPEYTAALVVEGEAETVSQWQWFWRTPENYNEFK